MRLAFTAPHWPIQDRATRARDKLLGPCFKTGRVDNRPTSRQLPLIAQHAGTRSAAHTCTHSPDKRAIYTHAALAAATPHTTRRAASLVRGILQVQSVQRDSHVPHGYKTSPLARARYLPEVHRVRSPRSSNWLRLCPPAVGVLPPWDLTRRTDCCQSRAPALWPGKSEPTSGDNFVAPPVYLHTVSRPIELSLQSSLQLSLTVLVCYRSRRDI